MTLIDRYLHAVRSFLPASRQDDIIRELAEDIHAQAADREEALGRPLTDAETGALLRQFGHPMLLAAKCRWRGRRWSSHQPNSTSSESCPRGPNLRSAAPSSSRTSGDPPGAGTSDWSTFT